ncbi:MAG: helix-turn-helix domain-containing protein [Bdellovibrionota bacterium]
MNQINAVELTPDQQVYFKHGMTLKEIEKNVILETLKRQRFNRTRTARVLQIGIRTLQRKLKQYKEIEMHAHQMDSIVN